MQAGLTPQPAGRFLGVNLRQDRVSMADEDMAKAINADLHTQPGAIVLRLGRTKLNSVAMTERIVRRCALINGFRYQAAGQSVFRDFAKILDNVLSANKLTTFVPYRPLADSTLWAFIADDAVMRKDNGASVYQWGITPPSVTPLIGATGSGSITAKTKVCFTYVRKSNGAVAAESNRSGESDVATVAGQNITVSGIVPSTDPQVTHCRLYRTLDNGALYFFDQDVTNGTTTALMTAIDSTLGTGLELDNYTPPLASWAEIWNETAWLCRDAANANRLWYSKRFRPESWPTSNFLDIGNTDDPLQCAVGTAAVLGVFSRKTKYRILGNATSGYVAQEALSRRGTPAPMAAVQTAYGVVFVGLDGIFATDFGSPDVALATKIESLFFGQTVNGLSPINWNAASTMAMASYKQRLYWAYASGTNTNPDTLAVYSNDTKNWYFYDHPMNALYYEELNDQLLGGGQDAFVYVLESGSTDAGANISLDCETKDFAGASKDIRKLFMYLKIDADTGGDALTVQLYLDDTLKATQTFTNTGRTTKLLPLPAGLLGYHWRLRFTYTGSQRIRIYPPACLYLPLGEA